MTLVHGLNESKLKSLRELVYLSTTKGLPPDVVGGCPQVNKFPVKATRYHQQGMGVPGLIWGGSGDPRGWGQAQGRGGTRSDVQGGPGACTMRPNTSWVMVTWELHVDRQ